MKAVSAQIICNIGHLDSLCKKAMWEEGYGCCQVG